MIAIDKCLRSLPLIERQSLATRLAVASTSVKANNNSNSSNSSSWLLSSQACLRLDKLGNSWIFSPILQHHNRGFASVAATPIQINTSISFGRATLEGTISTRRHHHHHPNSTETEEISINNSGLKNRRTMAKLISGKEVSDELRAQLKIRVSELKIKPKLAIVQVGGRQDSNVYIRMKIQFAESIGASAEHIQLPSGVTEEELASKVKQLNEDKTVHGIITQLPFDTTSKINSDYIVNLIDPMKDVDGLSIYNAGKLLHGDLNGSSFVPCTPNGCMELIKRSGISLEGTRSVVIGRSKIVGSPMAQLLLWKNSTVTICHSRTKNIDEICRQADIIVAAVGQAKMVKASWLKPGAVVIDCGINVIPDETKKSGTRLVGDVDFDECKEVASAITPVPGGVGPMTVAMLIANTVKSAERNQ